LGFVRVDDQLSELYEKNSKNKNESGWGFELSVRPQRGKGQQSPPEWVEPRGNTPAPR
jgi:hypothetical protein